MWFTSAPALESLFNKAAGPEAERKMTASVINLIVHTYLQTKLSLTRKYLDKLFQPLFL